MTVDICWLTSGRPEVLVRGYWDGGLLEHLFSRELWRPVNGYDFRYHECSGNLPAGLDGAVIIVPARWHVEETDWLNGQLAPLRWVLLILTGDEDGSFPRAKLHHPNIRTWIQTPHRQLNDQPRYESYLGDYWPEPAPSILKTHKQWADERPLGWFFSGQINNEFREKCRDILTDRLARVGDGRLNTTEIFGSGMEYPEYLRNMASAKIAPSPSGIWTPDTFRLFEALEAGCIPIADYGAPKGNPDLNYWRFLFGEDPPFPVIQGWADFDAACDRALATWPASANAVYSWWQGHKRKLVYHLEDDLATLIGDRPTSTAVEDLVTVLIPTSPNMYHPDTSAITETIASIRAQPGLGDCEIIVMIDGVRSEQEAHRANYEEYVRRLLWLTNFEWHNVVPLRFTEHTHQAAMTREALKSVCTPLILFVEHDAPLVGPPTADLIDWEGLCRVALSGQANVIRLYHEATIHPHHRHLMLDQRPQDVDGVPLIRTSQWSQRPHLARVDFYQQILTDNFGLNSLTMIEDVMHGIVQSFWLDFEEEGWRKFKLFIYAPGEFIKRSTHLDTRGDEPKWGNIYDYPGEPPIGSPAPSR